MREKFSDTSSAVGPFPIQVNQYQADKDTDLDQRIDTLQIDGYKVENLRIQDSSTGIQQAEAQHKSKVQEMPVHIHMDEDMIEGDIDWHLERPQDD